MSEKERNDAKKGENKGKPGCGKRILLRTFGCQMNTRDSEIVRGLLQEEGYCFIDVPQEADIVMVNTCSVRAHAEHRAVSVLGALIKKDRKHTKIFGLIGCLAQHKQKRLFNQLRGLHFICGPSDIYEIPRIVKKITSHQSQVTSILKQTRPLDFVNPAYRESKTQAFVNITYGCDNYCSYCIVPYLRGHEVFRPAEDILKEVQSLADCGISHITLLGQNVNSYSFLEAEKCGIKRGNTQNNISVAGKYSRAVNFVGLLEKVSEIEGVKKIDFVTSHPKDAGVKLFKAIARIPKINQYLHLPMQSGSNKILKLMKRGYTVEKYRKLVDSYRKIVPGGKLSTDIIVGFPGETEDDFKMTLEAVKEIKFDNAYIFKYSPRPPAESSKMVDDVPKEVKEQRHGELLEMQKRMYLERK